ncbi:vegetative cell wall protein gp1-like [Humulus lupulus]|uniref:vegetative cell wall protein gp1-like n=1 Tax=Humulus lupulus TaxID=3486 RepID=UPI002B410046|nr:vegetative cell wall protein gp1-like [Humulus lupulus]
MGRVKSIAQRKKKTTNPSSNQPSPRTEDPSTNPQPVNIVPPEIQTKARPRDGLRPEVEWYVAPPSIIVARMVNNYLKKYVMPSDDAFDLYSQPKTTAPASRKKESRQHPGESNSNPSKKRARIEDPPVPVPSKETTPPPAPIDQNPSPAPTDPTPSPAPVDQTPLPTPVD